MGVPSMKNLSVPRTGVSHRAGGREKLEEVFGGLCGELSGRNATQVGEERAGERGVGGGGNLHLRDEGGLLDGDLGIVEVVVVEADLADGEAAWVGCEFGKFGQSFGSSATRLLRMNAGGGEDLRMGVRKVECVVHLV